jgi:hypothetical protein
VVWEGMAFSATGAWRSDACAGLSRRDRSRNLKRGRSSCRDYDRVREKAVALHGLHGLGTLKS